MPLRKMTESEADDIVTGRRGAGRKREYKLYVELEITGAVTSHHSHCRSRIVLIDEDIF